MKICALLVTVAMKASLIQCSGCYVPVNVQVNTRLAGYSIGRFNVGSLQSCARMCLSFSVCKSFDYKKSHPEYTCKLNTRNSSTVSGSTFSNDNGSVFSDISTWPVELAGSCSQRSCQSNQICLPTGSSYVCKTIDCGEQPTITNGVIDSPSTMFRASLHVICLPGYRTVNHTGNIQCQASGEWRTPIPQCIQIDCGYPGIPHATYIVSSTTYEAIIDITCEDGYQLNGASSINCLDNGTWSAVPECLQIDCGDPAIATSTYNDTATVYDTFLEVTCDVGFMMNGSSVIMCLSNGLWTAKPTCYQASNCGDPAIAYSTYNDTATVYGTFLEVTCDVSFMMNGSSVIMCLSNGLWTAKPTCYQASNCGDPAIAYSTYNDTATVYGTFLEVTCDVSFMMNGSSVIMCLSNGLWTAKPTCYQASDCGDPAIAYSTYNDTATVYGTFLEVTCDVGFMVNGSLVITCQSNGMWTAKPTCFQGNSSCEGLDCFTFYPDAYLSAYYAYPHIMVSSIESVGACLQLCDEQYPSYLSINYSPNNKWCGCYGFTYQEYINDRNTAYAGYDLYEKISQ